LVVNDDTVVASLSLEGNVYENFINAIRSEVTKYEYTFAIKKFMQYQKVSRLEDLLSSDVNIVDVNVNNFLGKIVEVIFLESG
jgi:hypothetical protein